MRLRTRDTTKALNGAFVVLAALAFAGAGTSLAALRGTEEAERTAPKPPLVVRGNVGGLYPGVPSRLTVTVVNRNRFPVVVRSLRTSVGDASPACTRTNLAVRAFRGAIRVPSRASRKLRLRITLRATAPDACREARFPLRYRVTAVKP